MFNKTINVYTDGSAIPNPGHCGFGIFAIDNEGIKWNGYGYVSNQGTNNLAELTATIKALEWFLETELYTQINIYSDSKYVIDNIKYVKKWKSNNWLTSTGSQVANYEQWNVLNDILENTPIKIVFNWTKGHSNNSDDVHAIGNDLADKNADKGRLNKNNIDYFGKTDMTVANSLLEIVNEEENEIETTEKATKKKSKTKVVKSILNPLLSGKRWFFYTNKSGRLENGLHYYTTSTYDDSKLDNNKKLAKKSADTHYAILLTDMGIPELECIRNKYNSTFSIDNLPIVSDLSTIVKPAVWSSLNEEIENSVVIKDNLAVTKDSSVVGSIQNPPKLIYKLENIYSFGFSLIDKYLSNSNSIYQFDITNTFYSKDEKDKTILNPNLIMGIKTVTISNLNSDVLNINNLILIMGIDCPLRNNFSNLLKQSKELIKVTLLVYDVSEYSYRVATIITQGNDIAVYYNPDANYRIINLPLKGK